MIAFFLGLLCGCLLVKAGLRKTNTIPPERMFVDRDIIKWRK